MDYCCGYGDDGGDEDEAVVITEEIGDEGAAGDDADGDENYGESGHDGTSEFDFERAVARGLMAECRGDVLRDEGILHAAGWKGAC